MTVRPLCCSKEQEMVLLHRVTELLKDKVHCLLSCPIYKIAGGGGHTFLFSSSFHFLLEVTANLVPLVPKWLLGHVCSSCEDLRGPV